MNIAVVGLSHKTASVEIREKLNIPETQIESSIRHLLRLPHIEEIAIISTCNRLEIYAVVKKTEQGIQEIYQFLSEISHIPDVELKQYTFVLHNQETAWHLMRVAAGLDSLVIGEGQILCQVKKAYRLAQTYKGFNKILERLFKQAITAGKRVRHETDIGSGAVSISSAAVELAQMKVPDFMNCKIAVIGAGKMSRLLVKHLLAKKASNISIVNRCLSGAEDLANSFPGAKLHPYSLLEMMSVVANSDIVFTSTSSTEPILDRAKLEQELSKNHSLMLCDISVPRNVHVNVNELKNIILYNVDDLQIVVAQNQEARRQSAKQAEILLTEEVRDFQLWLQSLETLPTISSLRSKVENIREQELEKALSRLGNEFSEKHGKVLEALTKGIINKILHEPMVQLRTQDDVETQRLTIKTVRMLFNLDTEETFNSVGKTNSRKTEKKLVLQKTEKELVVN